MNDSKLHYLSFSTRHLWDQSSLLHHVVMLIQEREKIANQVDYCSNLDSNGSWSCDPFTSTNRTHTSRLVSCIPKDFHEQITALWQMGAVLQLV